MSLEIWYNNLKVAAYAAARVRCTRPSAGAQGFENIEPCKTAVNAVLLRPPVAASWYNNLKVAACAAARVQGTRPCAGAQGFENIEPCKTAANAVLLWPLRGGMV